MRIFNPILSLIAFSVLFLACTNNYKTSSGRFTEADVLDELDRAFKDVPGKYFPSAGSKDIRYNFFIDLEHGYFVTAGA